MRKIGRRRTGRVAASVILTREFLATADRNPGLAAYVVDRLRSSVRPDRELIVDLGPYEILSSDAEPELFIRAQVAWTLIARRATLVFIGRGRR